MGLPLISCLCVSKNVSIISVIKNYLLQTYQNKELIIVCHDDHPCLEILDTKYNNLDNIYLHILDKSKLGDLRNKSIELCNGEYFIQWDDDDWYHYQRIETQYNDLIKSGKDAIILKNVFLYYKNYNQTYVYNWQFEGSILVKNKPNYRYTDKEKAEDTDLIMKLSYNNELFISNKGYLYIYIFHMENTWHNIHFYDSIRVYKNISYNIDDIINYKLSTLKESSMLCENIYQKSDNVLKYKDNIIHQTWKDHNIPSKYVHCTNKLREINN